MKEAFTLIVTKPGKESTQETIQLAIDHARQAGIKHIVVASNAGVTAEHLLPYADEFKITVVSQVYGFRGDGEPHPMSAETRKKLQDAGMQIYFGTHVLSGAERGLSTRFQGVYPVEIIAHTLRMLSQGVKVGVEISVMALDAGLIPKQTPVVAIAGSGRGADTACVIVPAHAQRILETRVKEIICKP